MPELAVTAVGADRPGIVAAVSEVLHERGGNVTDSAMTILGGHFAIMLLLDAEDEPEALREALAPVADELGLELSVSLPATSAPSADPTHLLSVYGADAPGLLAGITRALAEARANITDLETRLIGASDEPVYAMVIELAVADGGEEAVAARVEDAAARLGVDHTLRAIETETY